MITVDTILKSVMRKWWYMTTHRVCNKNNTAGTSSGAGTSFPSGTLEFSTLEVNATTFFGPHFTQLAWICFPFSAVHIVQMVCVFTCVQHDFHVRWRITIGQELLILQDPSCPRFCEGFELIYLYWCIVVCIIFCRSLSVFWSFFFCQLYLMYCFWLPPSHLQNISKL